jgi:hypothetical protein
MSTRDREFIVCPPHLVGSVGRHEIVCYTVRSF